MDLQHGTRHTHGARGRFEADLSIAPPPGGEGGGTASAARFPAGRYTLEARMPGGRVASVPVTLVDGETLSVTLEL